MNQQSSAYRARRSALEVPCCTCNNPMPYDPTDPVLMCPDCQIQAIQAHEAFSDSTMLAPTQQNTDYSTPIPMSMPMTPQSEFMQQTPYATGGGAFQHNPSLAYDNRQSSLQDPRVRHGVGKGAMQTPSHGLSSVFPDDEGGDDDEFVDAPEQQPFELDENVWPATPSATYGGSGGWGSSAFTRVDQDESMGGLSPKVNTEWETSPDLHADTMEENPSEEEQEKAMEEGEEEDLFSKTFSKPVHQDSDDEIEEVDKNTFLNSSPDPTRASHNNSNTKTVAKFSPKPKASDLRTTNARPSRSIASTTFRYSSQAPGVPSPPDPVNSLSYNYTYLRDLHHRALMLKPRLPLEGHRYWIGVLNIDRTTKNFSREKHFTWMKGNRVTTVSTVWHTYQTSTATDRFVLLLGLERVEFRDKMEELDYFNDKMIFFRAVNEGHEDAGGREACESVIPRSKQVLQTEVIELDC